MLREHRFTNPYRAADRVSQYLIRSVIYKGDQEFIEVCFRTLLFKIFNKIKTWELLVDNAGFPKWKSFDIERYDRVLSEAFNNGQRLYSAAYVMAPPQFGAERKHTNHLRLLNQMISGGIANRLGRAPSLSAAFQVLRTNRGIGDFLAFQYLIDLNYSNGLSFDAMEFVRIGLTVDELQAVKLANTRGLSTPASRASADEQGPGTRMPFAYDPTGQPFPLVTSYAALGLRLLSVSWLSHNTDYASANSSPRPETLRYAGLAVNQRPLANPPRAAALSSAAEATSSKQEPTASADARSTS